MQEFLAYVIAGDKFLTTKERKPALLTQFDIANIGLEPNVSYDLKLRENDKTCVSSVKEKNVVGFSWLSLRSLYDQLTEDEFQAAGRALQILRWHVDHQFCGRCGKPTEQNAQDFAKHCAGCSLDFYPRLSPCIITLVTREDECLLAWHIRSKEERYSCLAGFIEMGESPEQTLEREVMEEVGLSVSDVRYVASQPWPFPGQLMLGYFATYSGGDILVDKREIVTARWYRYDQLPTIPSLATISGRLINRFVQERRSIHINNDQKIR